MARKPLPNGETTRQRIEREALRLFAEQGVDGTSIRDIALAVGVADAALYRHFESKEQLSNWLFASHYARLAAHIRAIAELPDTFHDKLGGLIGLFCRLFDEDRDAFRFILLSQHIHLPLIGDDGNVVVELRALMAQAAASGVIAIEDADLAAAIALGTVLQPAVFTLYGRLHGALRDRVGTLTQVAARALGLSTPAPAG